MRALLLPVATATLWLATAHATPPTPSLSDTPSQDATPATSAPLSHHPITPRRSVGALTGLTVYLSAGHGWASLQHTAGYQRDPAEQGLVEDMWTAAFCSDRLIPALEAAGAVVLTPRERDPSPFSVTVGADAPTFTASALLWHERAAPNASAHTSPLAARLPPQAHATWQVPAPRGGARQVYARWIASTGADPAATYTVTTGEDSRVVTVDQRSHGGEWFPLASVLASEGDAITVTLRGSGVGTLSADQVRVGGGSAHLWDATHDTWVDLPQYNLAAVHHQALTGVPTAVWAPPGSGANGDASARARWTSWSHPADEDAVFLSIHTNAGGGHGTQAFVRQRCPARGPCAERVRRSEDLARRVRDATVGTLSQYAGRWSDRGVQRNNLAEINDMLNPEVPAALLEVGFHDSRADASVLVDDDALNDLADNLRSAIIRWYRPDAPLPPPRPTLTWDGLVASWALPDASPPSGATTGWRVRLFEHQRWSAPTWTTATSVSTGATTSRVEVAAVGPGGASRTTIVDRGYGTIAEGEPQSTAPPGNQ